MASNIFADVMDLLQRLDEARLSYSLSAPRPRTLTVTVNVPGEIWEIEFSETDGIGVEVFRSRAGVEGREAVDELFARFTD